MTLFFWKIFYFFMCPIITLICCIDSWEYLYQAQTLPFQDFFHQIQFTVFQSEAYSSITKIAFLTSLFYSFPILVFMLLRFCSPSLFFEELYTFFSSLMFVFLAIQASLRFTNLFLPIYLEDLFYYQNQKDFMVDFEFKWILEPHFYLMTKMSFFFFFFIFLLMPLFFYFCAIRKRDPFFLFLEKKRGVYLFFVIFFFLFFEARFQETVMTALFFIGYCELICFILCIIYNYDRTFHILTHFKQD